MRATGIIRRIDDLGRVVIPREIRRSLHIKEGDPLEIFTNQDGSVIFKKYSFMSEAKGMATGLCEAMRRVSGGTWAVTDRDTVIAAAGERKRGILDKRITPDLEQIMESRRAYPFDGEGKPVKICSENEEALASMAAPILSEGEVIGLVLYCDQERIPPSDAEYKLAQTTAAFLGRYMES